MPRPDPTTPPAPAARSAATALRLVVVVGAGVVAALQVGKGVIALPLVKAEMGLSLSEATAIVSVFAVFTALAALPAGVAAPRIGARRAFVAGLGLIAVGSLAGAAADGFATLLATRVLEGGGFLLVVTSAPVLLATLAGPRNRDVVFAVWGSYMPLGMGLMILAGAFVAAIGWKAIWLANGAVAGAWCLLGLLAPAVPRRRDPERRLPTAIAETLGHFFRTRQPFLVAALFFSYGLMYFSAIALLPVLLTGPGGASIATAGMVAALLAFANAGGNVAAGPVLQAGVGYARLAVAVFLPAAALVSVLFALVRGPVEAAFLAVLAAALMGFLPGSTMAVAPRLARQPGEVGAVVGLFIQFTAVAQFLAPPAFAFLVEHAGWSVAPAWYGALAVVAVLLAAAVAREERRRRDGAGTADAPPRPASGHGP